MHRIIYAFVTFGKGSELARGVDADLIIDNMLVDIKTTKSDSFTQDMYNQLLGYYALSIFRKDLDGIMQMGVYFSRYGEIGRGGCAGCGCG